MARRNDHSPEELKALIREAAGKIIENKGLSGLTARQLAAAIGYTPGTIYNVYRDMDALVAELNYQTLGAIMATCQDRIKSLPDNMKKVKALAYAYADFAHQHRHAWETLFGSSRQQAKLSKAYQERIAELFAFIEQVLLECLGLTKAEAARSARLLWAALHGITTLTLDGRLPLISIDPPHKMIDTLLENYFGKVKA